MDLDHVISEYYTLIAIDHPLKNTSIKKAFDFNK